MMPKTNSQLSRDLILQAAVQHADEHGVESVNLRALAKELGVGAMTLYTYIDNKADLISGMVDSVAAEIEVPTPDVPWRESITTIALATRNTIFQHPWVNPFWASAGGPAKMDLQEAILRIFRAAGFSVADACRGYHAVTMHAVGFAMQVIEYPTNATDLKEAAGNFLSYADERRYPYFVEHVRYHFDYPDAGGEFEFVLNAVLDRLALLLEKPEEKPE